MRIGYARVSSTDQETALQVAALERAGVERVYQERLSAVVRRPQLEAMLSDLKRGDEVVVYKVDRLARSLSHLLKVLERIEAVGAVFRSLTEPIETGTLLGRLMLQLLGSFAEFERGVIRERCAAGTKAAMARGVKCGRPRKLDWAEVSRLSLAGLTVPQLAAKFDVHDTSIRWALKRYIELAPAVGGCS